MSFWTGRGSSGQATIRKIEGNKVFLDPFPDAIKGSDYRLFSKNAARKDAWMPRDYGVLVTQINTPPQPWYENS